MDKPVIYKEDVHNEPVLWENPRLRVLKDTEEPWRCYVEYWNGTTWEYLDNPRLTEMAEMSLALLTEFKERNQGW